jgi:dihydrofolate reductase
MNKPTLTLIVAMAQNYIIGRDGALPWRLSSDLKRFKVDTIGKPVIMGRKTYQSIGRLLPDRTNIIVSRNPDFAVTGAFICADITAAVDIAQQKAIDMGARDIAVIGGGDIYRQTIDHADILIVTWVQVHIEGDTLFPPIDPRKWREATSLDFAVGEKDSYATRHTIYHKIH